MNSLIIIQEKHYSWLRSSESAGHPAMVTVCNKPLLEYLVDFSVLLGCEKIRLVLEEPDETVAGYFGNGERWGAAISYGNSRADDSVSRIVEKNGSFGENDPLIVFEGLLFFHYDKNSRYEVCAQGSGSGLLYGSEAGSLSYRTAAGTDHATEVKLQPGVSISAPRNHLDLFNLAMRVVRVEQHRYVLPGYGSEKGVVLGRNVEIARTATVHEPVVVGSNVRILAHAVVGPNVVIGDNVIVDDGSEVHDSVVLANTYIGRRLFIKEKIVAGNRVLSVKDGTSIAVSDEFFLSPIKAATSLPLLRYALNLCGVVPIALLQLLPFCILCTIRRLRDGRCLEKKPFLLSSEAGTTSSFLTVLHQSAKAGGMARTFSLDKFPLLRNVLSGELQLVGNRLIPDTAEGREFARDFSTYLPGIFNYTEADRLEPGTMESEIAERYYSANRGFLEETKTLFKALFNNLIST
jgi:acetyltransferase-like isoleucine patch superfamily enzyme